MPESSTITIDTTAAETVSNALITYVGQISPMVLAVLGAALGIGLIFWVVRLFLRGAKASSR